MTTRKDLLASALRLPPEERRLLIRDLLLSLEGEPADDPLLVQREWSAEITRRAEAVVAGTAVTVDGRMVVQRALREMKAKLPPGK